MIQVQILEKDDRIEATDWVRQLSLTFDGQSEYLATTATYGGSRMNRLGWMLAAEVCPAFIGKKVKAFNKLPSAGCRYEFIRGDIPKSHMEPGEPKIFPDLIPAQHQVFGGGK